MISIWLVWRYNVWKSTIFNRLLWQFRAIVTDIKWTTREVFDEVIDIDWYKFKLFDVPWLEEEHKIEVLEDIANESDIILFVVDWKEWLTPQDRKIAEFLYKNWLDDKVILVVNKLDSKVYTDKVYEWLAEFYELGFKNIIWISAKQNEGFEDLKDAIFQKIKKLWLQTKLEDNIEVENLLEEIPLAIVWRPNVWKSTLLNSLYWKEKAKVEDKLGTTLDYIKAEIIYKWKKIVLYDTAWIRKKGKIHWLEKIAYSKTISLLQFKKPVTVVLIDILEGVVHRDLTIVGDLIKLKLPLIIAVNKIDELTKEEFEKKFNDVVKAFSFAKWIPIVPISAKTWKNFELLLDWVEKVFNEYHKRVQTSDLNKVIHTKRLQKPPRFPKNKICKVYYATQPEEAPPTFVFFINKEKYVNFAFKRWLENTIRENFWFIWSPLVFEFREKQKDKR